MRVRIASDKSYRENLLPAVVAVALVLAAAASAVADAAV